MGVLLFRKAVLAQVKVLAFTAMVSASFYWVRTASVAAVIFVHLHRGKANRTNFFLLFVQTNAPDVLRSSLSGLDLAVYYPLYQPNHGVAAVQHTSPLANITISDQHPIIGTAVAGEGVARADLANAGLARGAFSVLDLDRFRKLADFLRKRLHSC